MYLLFDIGATNSRLALSQDYNTFEKPLIFTTPQNFNDWIDRIKKEKDLIGMDRRIQKVVVGIRGILNKEKSMIIKDTYLNDWVDKPLKERLSEIFNSEVLIENDASLAGLGEAVKGAGKGYKIVAYITLSTGIGGVRIVDGKIDANRFGFEPGHQIIDCDGTVFPHINGKEKDWSLGELESLASGKSILLRFGKNPQEITDKNIWREIHKNIAVGLANTIVHWSPDVVVLGGALVNKITIQNIILELEKVLKIFPELPLIKKSELGDFSGLYGGLEYSK